MTDFLITTDAARIPTDRQIVAVCGTVPGWTPKAGDLHADRYRPGGADVQMDEITPMFTSKIREDSLLVAPQLDGETAATAAATLLMRRGANFDRRKLWAIAHDSAHLCLPPEEEWDDLREFATRGTLAVRADLARESEREGLPPNRKTWTEDQRFDFFSRAFERSTSALTAAAAGEAAWPGDNGEADGFLDRNDRQRELVFQACRVRKGCVIFDARPFDWIEVDPRLVVEWSEKQSGIDNPIFLVSKDGSHLPGVGQMGSFGGVKWTHELRTLPFHSGGCPKFADRRTWEALDQLEQHLRDALKIPHPETKWGGGNFSGWSGRRDPLISEPDAVIDRVVAHLYY